MQFFLVFLALVFGSSLSLELHSAAITPLQESEAHFALKHLQTLSDSGIYKTLSLSGIISASTTDGVFHSNTKLVLEFASPYFKSGEPTSIHNVIVMTSNEEHADKIPDRLNSDFKSLAIDEFPKMDDKAIEKFWITKTDNAQQRRNELYEELANDSNLAMRRHNKLIEAAELITLPLSVTDATQAKLKELDSSVLSKIIDHLKGEGPMAESAKALLNDRYIRSSFMGLGVEQLGIVIKEKGLDPNKRRVAAEIISEMQNL